MASGLTNHIGENYAGRESFIRIRLLLVLSVLCLTALGVLGAPIPTGKPTTYPAWWFSRSVIVPLNPTNSAPTWPASYPTSDDYAVINQGQFKNFATQAYNELQAQAPSYIWSTSNGTALTSLITGWNPTSGDAYAAVNLGQLKTVGKAFYDVLIQMGYATSYPWTGIGADDYSVANIGQVKNAFCFDVGLDNDGNGLPDWWELKYFGHLGNSGSADSDGDGLSSLQEFQQGGDPTNYYSQSTTTITPTLTLVSTNNQTSPPGTFTSLPLIVRVTNSVGGAALINAPVTFTVTVGGGLVAATSGGVANPSITLHTDGSGYAQVYYQQSTNASVTSTIVATTASQSVNFTAISSTAPLPANWSDYDLGTVGVAGSSAYNSGVFSVSGAGAGMGGSSDNGHLISQQVNGNLEIIAHVSSLQNTGPYATAGLMMRESSSANAASVYVAVSPTSGLTFTTRTATGVSSTVSLGASQAAPVWLRLVRSATTITSGGTSSPGFALAGYYSTDGTTWTVVGSQSFAMANNVLMGLAVSSNTTAQTAIAAFDGVSVMTNMPQRSSSLIAWYRADVGAMQSGANISQWQDQSSYGNNVASAGTTLPNLVTNDINGHAAIHFTHASGVGSYMSAADNASLDPSTITIFAVAKTTGTTGGRIVDKITGTTAGYSLRYNSTTVPVFFSNAGTKAGGTITAGNAILLEGQCDSTGTLSIYENGGAAATSTYTAPLTATTQPLSIGGTSASNTTADCDIAEVLIYNGALSISQRQQVEAYLYQKYAVGTQPTAVAPTLSSKTGIYTSLPAVTITPGQTGELLYYTTDGSTPGGSTSGTPSGTSTLYTSGTVTVPSSGSTLKVIAVQTGYVNSSVVSGTYTVDSSTSVISNLSSSLVAWYRADVGTPGSGSVTTWPDQSGNLNDLTGAGTTLPAIVSSDINGKTAIHFTHASGVGSYMSVADNTTLAASYVTIFAVAKTTGTTGGRIVDKITGTTAGYFLRYNSTTVPAFFANAGTKAGSTITAGNAILLEGQCDSTGTISIYENGGAAATSTYTAPLTATTQPLSIGGTSASNTTADCDVAEVLVYNGVLNTSQRQQVEAYLYQRYALGTVPTAATPTLSIQTGIYPSLPAVTITPGQTGELIYYTTDGSTPGGSTTGTPSGTSTLYAGGTVTVPSSGATLKIVAVQAGYASSTVVSGTYTADSSTSVISNLSSSLVAWYRADVGTPGSGNVTVWPDQSGHINPNDLTGGGATLPSIVTSDINGKTAIHFTHASGVGSYMSAADNASLDPSTITIFAVAKTTGTTGGRIVDKITGTPAGYSLRYNSTTVPAFFANAGTKAGSTITAGNAILLEGQCDSTGTISIYENGGAAATSTYTAPLTATTQPLSIGGTSASNTTADCDIAEVLVYNGVLSTSQRQQVEAYLYQRYALGTSPTAPAPTLSIQTGIYPSLPGVTITPGQTGELIYYTTDGSTPGGNTTGTPSGTSALYTSGTVTVPSSGNTLKVIAVQSGYVNSSVISGTYTADSSTSVISNLSSSLVAWYRADVGTPGSGNVTAWPDQSGKLNNLTGAGTTLPAIVTSDINGKTAIHFTHASGVGSYMSVADNASLDPSTITIFAVAKTTGTTGGRIVDKITGTTAGYSLRYNSTTVPAFFANAGTKAGSTITVGNAILLEGQCDSTGTLSIYENGGAAATSTYTAPLTATTQPLSIGGTSASSTTADCDVAEVLVYSGVLSTPQRQQVEAYLYQRYALGTSPTAAAPTLSAQTGIYPSLPAVTISSSQVGELLYYTTDGSTPGGSTTGTPSGTSTLYTSGTVTVPSSGATLKVVAVQAGYANSAVVSGTYTADSSTSTFKGVVGFPALAAWYRADVGTPGSGSVTTWLDQSGNLNDLTGAGTTLPAIVTSDINGKTAIHFTHASGVGSYMSVADNTTLAASYVTVFSVAKTTGTTGGRIVDKITGTTAGYSLRYNSTTVPAFFANAGTKAGSTITAGNAILLEGQCDSTGTLSIYENGGAAATSTYTAPLTATTQPLSIGGTSASNTTADCDIAEVLVYNGALSTSQRQQVEAYLYQRYALGTAAPAPTLDKGTGIYPSLPAVTITPGQTGELIYYTTDGSTPAGSTSGTPSGTSTLYTSGTVTAPSSGATLKVVAVQAGYANSSVVSGTYTIDASSATVRATQLSTLVAWYRADVGTPGSGSVTTWPDQSGNFNDLAGGGATLPSIVTNDINGKTAVHFTHSSGSGSYMSVADNASLDPSTITIFTVIKGTGTTLGGRFLDKFGSSTGYAFRYSSSATPTFYVNASSKTGAALSDWTILEGKYDGTNVSIYENGGPPLTAALSGAITANTQPLCLGGTSASNTTADCDIAEVLIYNGALSDQDRLAVEYYLNQRYNFLILGTLAVPQFSLGGGTLGAPQEIGISSPPGTTVYYTTDGTTPTTSSLVYTGPIYVSYTETIKAIAYQNGVPVSSVASATYTLNATLWPAPTTGNPTPPNINLQLPANATLLP